jgi:TetR/AcrR family transcriptional regulator, transcriptional repressor for nem operon
MKVSREQAALNRERILEAAAQLFRERGFDGIGVADLMKQAGLTHGGFYGHFSSKEELIAEASARALTSTFALLSEQAERAAGDPLSAVASTYLSSRHRDDPGTGCLLAALGPDVIATIRARAACSPRSDRTCRDRAAPSAGRSPTTCGPLSIS